MQIICKLKINSGEKDMNEGRRRKNQQMTQV